MNFGFLKEFPIIYNFKRNQKMDKKCSNGAGPAFGPRLRLAGPVRQHKPGWPGKRGMMCRAPELVTTCGARAVARPPVGAER
jgi:hypothetical protein